MRHLAPALLIAAAAVPAAAQETATPPKDVGCVVRTALNYIEGALSSDAERIARSTHSAVAAFTVRTQPNGRQALSPEARGMPAALGVSHTPEAAKVEVVVFDAGPSIASARATSGQGYDLLQLAKIDGKWKIVNVLWSDGDAAIPSRAGARSVDDSAAVVTAARDYVEGVTSGDPARVERALHPALTRVLLVRDPDSGQPLLHRIGAASLVEAARAVSAAPGDASREISVTIYDLAHGMAAAKVTVAREVEHLQLAKLDGEWKVVAVLSAPSTEELGPVS